MKLNIDNYPGSKGANGVYQWIINQIPYYTLYAELFGGSAFIAEKIAPLVQKQHVVIEKSKTVWMQYPEDTRPYLELPSPQKKAENILYENGCGRKWLKSVIDTQGEAVTNGLFVYLDPPYIKTSRRDPRNIYEHEWTDEQHKEFLELVVQAKFKIMISGYDCEMYNDALVGWRTSTFDTMTRGGIATEKIWMNYDISTLDLATSEFLGRDFKDRQRINRRKKAYANKFLKMPLHERNAILHYIQNNL